MTKAPYPMSTYIASLQWAPAGEITRLARGIRYDDGTWDGSDNWPLAWADDDRLYTVYGDGYGFDPVVTEKLGLGFAYIEGNPPNLRCCNYRCHAENQGFGRKGKKGSGYLAGSGKQYLWLFHADEQGGQSQLAISADYGKTWFFCDWVFEDLGLCTFINYGKAGENVRDGYIYMMSHDGPRADVPADGIVLMRVHIERAAEKTAYAFFCGTDQGQPTWSADFSRRKHAFVSPGGCLRTGISYNAPLERYFLWQHIPREPGHKDRGDTRFEGGFGIYEAPQPWGPWSTVYHTRQWDVGPGERGEFPPKWMSADGRTMVLAFSGDDNFCLRKASLVLA